MAYQEEMIRRKGLGVFEYLLSNVYMSGTVLNVLYIFILTTIWTEIIVTSYGNDCELLTK